MSSESLARRPLVCACGHHLVFHRDRGRVADIHTCAVQGCACRRFAPKAAACQQGTPDDIARRLKEGEHYSEDRLDAISEAYGNGMPISFDEMLGVLTSCYSLLAECAALRSSLEEARKDVGTLSSIVRDQRTYWGSMIDSRLDPILDAQQQWLPTLDEIRAAWRACDDEIPPRAPSPRDEP